MIRLNDVKTEHDAAVYLMLMILNHRALAVVEQLQHVDMLADTVIDLGKLVEKYDSRT